MPRVDFYILPDADAASRQLFLCRLVEKAFKLGNKIYIHCASAPEAQYLDDLLWTFRQNSFLPHLLYQGEQQDFTATPILIGWQHKPQLWQQLLINISAVVPEFYQQFERVAEVVTQQPELLQQLRERYAWYRDAGCLPEVHRL